MFSAAPFLLSSQSHPAKNSTVSSRGKKGESLLRSGDPEHHLITLVDRASKMPDECLNVPAVGEWVWHRVQKAPVELGVLTLHLTEGWQAGPREAAEEAVGPQQWQSWCELLLKCHGREGHCNVPDRHLEEGQKLGRWVGKQRQRWKAGKLSTEKQRQLDQLDFVWDVLEEQWQSQHQLLLKFEVS